MNGRRDLDPQEVGLILRCAQASEAPASIRAIGNGQILGHLRVGALEAGVSLQLIGLGGRDGVPPRGAMVMLVIPLEEEIVSLYAPLLTASPIEEGDAPSRPVLSLGWPSASAMAHRRKAVQVAHPGRPPLPAVLRFGEHTCRALLLNLSEGAVGLGLVQPLLLDLHAQVELETVLPGGPTFCATGQVHQSTWLEEDPLPTRLRLVLGCMIEADREALRRFLQIRHADHLEGLRGERPSGKGLPVSSRLATTP